MIGDHMLVDRMTYSNPGSWESHLLPYRDVQRGDIVCFHYPEDVRQIYVKRVIGIPGDRIRMENKQVVRNGQRLREPYTQHIDPTDRRLPRQLPAVAASGAPRRAAATCSRTTCATANSSCRRERSSSWATIAKTRRTAAIGAWCRAIMWWASRWWSTGRTTRPRRTSKVGRWATSWT